MSEAKPSAAEHHHRRAAAAKVATAVVTVSDTRSEATDSGGDLVVELLSAAGHPVVSREIVPDAAEAIVAALDRARARGDVEALVYTGGTGVAPRDVTPEALAPQLDRVIPGFGELFRQLSYEEVGSAALLSRALAGLAGDLVVFALPGSRNAVRLALEKLVLPELGHLVGEARKTR